MNITVPIYQERDGNRLHWTTLTLGPHTCSRSGRNALKLQQALVGELKGLMARLAPRALEPFALSRGVSLERLRLELTLRSPGSKRKVTGLYPVVLEPRWLSRERRILIGYHPGRQEEWFPLDDDAGEAALEERAARYFSKAWVGLSTEQIRGMQTSRKDRIKAISFSVQPPSLLDDLPERRGGVWDDLEPDLFKAGKKKKKGGLRVLRQLGLDQTRRAADMSLPLGTPRSPYREQLQLLLTGEHRRPVVVVGPPQVGKTTLLNNWINDLLLADGYEAHRNLDRVHHVWQISGQRIISGMSYLGDWEQRCIDLLHDASGRRVILLVEDLHGFGRLGRTRDSDRNLAEFFRGPLGRGELTLVGECTPEQLQRLEQDAPSFAAHFARVRVAETTPAETLRMMLHEARGLELAHQVAFEPHVFRSVIELGGSIFSGSAFPGKALDLVRALGKAAQGKQREDGARPRVEAADVIGQVSRRTGLPEALIRVDQPLDARGLRERFERRIMGQDAAVTAACELVLRIRAGLTDGGRPYGVFLFAGPTGTGKTELTKCLAEYLYDDPARLLRFDMGEYGDADAAPRLVGDQIQPRGALTEQVRRQPFCVLLLDEIEKAHPAVLNLLLQLFDEGRLTDAAGTTADFSHTAVVMTSNLGSRPRAPAGFTEDDEAAVHETHRAVREFFAPELFNRIDRVIPFSPLTREVARRIGAKELSQLLARRGLSERNVFVHPSGRVLDRVVAEGFDALYGARPVKRYLDQRIGGLMADQISGSPAASMQIMHLYTDERARSAFRLHTEAMTEAPVQVERLPLEPLLDAPARELQQRLPAALDTLDALLDGEALEQLAERMSFHLGQHRRADGADGHAEHADALYNLEQMRTRLRRLKGRVGHLHVNKRAHRGQILECLAEVSFLQRALGKVHQPGQHAVFVELSQVGVARRVPGLREGDDSLMDALAGAYLNVSPAVELEGWAARGGPYRAGARLDSVRTGSEEAVLSGDGEDGDRLLEARRGSPAQLVLKLVGLNVLDLLAGEQGSHIWRSLGRGSDVLRVRVWPVGSDGPAEASAAEVIARHVEGAAAFSRGLEQGAEPLPENPDRLLPLVREYRFDPSAQPRQGAPLDLVDYALGYAASLKVRTLADGLRRLWLLRMSVEESEQ